MQGQLPRNDLGGVRDAWRDFVFVLLPDFSLLSLAGFIEPLRLVNAILRRSKYSWRLLSDGGYGVVSSAGVVAPVDGDLKATQRPCSIIVLGGDHVAPSGEALSAWLCRMSRFGSLMGSVGSATYILASAGLLHERRVAVHWRHMSSFEERFPRVNARSTLYEFDRDRLSCAGETASVDAIISFLATLEEEEVMSALCGMLLKDRIRHATDATVRYRIIRNSVLRRALEIMESEIESPLDVEYVAQSVGRSRRQLERLFHRYLGGSPVAHYRNLRLDKARDLLLNTSMRVIAVAAACGFASQQSFTRAYRARFGHSPFEERGIVKLQISREVAA